MSRRRWGYREPWPMGRSLELVSPNLYRPDLDGLAPPHKVGRNQRGVPRNLWDREQDYRRPVVRRDDLCGS
jgi:hypothetical protein